MLRGMQLSPNVRQTVPPGGIMVTMCYWETVPGAQEFLGQGESYLFEFLKAENQGWSCLGVSNSEPRLLGYPGI